ncbi:hypothetical protein FEI17_03815 [Kosakonia radicincitans]|jgi:hypothetical protein|uniref:Uncharacterized protein n=2 Tax=Enterobacteriaceae TaxID=543 RepID=A0A7H0RWW0_SALER|nr:MULTISPECIES: hypothetical protein [Enterobacteriaceae]ECA5023880.1 hypothetical protein [Salmonella enterica subsp. enterica serovar Ohio]ECE8812351.1 hypothetical protein [Salmonella enterica subsp. enterica serovar Virchow]MDZ1372660.1 hypothetical protein [Klebsiella pneumoniae]MPS85128.1 hypothetical protein [Enterobacter sp.]HAT7495852.1 hypothetical protein [Raoultella ornithinolytica]HCM9335962.1 hypothetical protein [Enterobacter asburiae]HEB0918644.1 hypothetical protein [Entero
MMNKNNAGNLSEPNQARPVAAIRPSPEMQEMHFVLQDRCHTVLMPLETLLRCLREAEKLGEVPVIPEAWWSLLNCKYPEIS